MKTKYIILIALTVNVLGDRCTPDEFRAYHSEVGYQEFTETNYIHIDYTNKPLQIVLEKITHNTIREYPPLPNFDFEKAKLIKNKKVTDPTVKGYYYILQLTLKEGNSKTYWLNFDKEVCLEYLRIRLTKPHREITRIVGNYELTLYMKNDSVDTLNLERFTLKLGKEDEKLVTILQFIGNKLIVKSREMKKV
jgi:hypothetical protein